MYRERNVVIDDVEINPTVLQTIYEKVRPDLVYEFLLVAFNIGEKVQQYEENPNDLTIKQSIKQLMTEVRNLSPLPRPIRMEIDPNEEFILNKPGTFSELSRKCQISEKGLMEYEDGKQKKLKEVRDVVNKIEREGDKDNDNKIKWIAEPKKYPFRVVLLDRNDSHKALYFSSLERAEQIKARLCHLYRYKGTSLKETFRMTSILLNNAVEGRFVDKLLYRFRLLKKTNRISKKKEVSNVGSVPIVSESRSLFKGNEYIANILGRPSESRTQKGYDGDMINSLISGHQSDQKRITSEQKLQENSVILLPVTKGFEEMYTKKFMESWLIKARVQGQAKSKEASIVEETLKKEPVVPKKDPLAASSSRSDLLITSIVSKGQGQSQPPSVTTIELLFVEFLKRQDIFFKPIVTIELLLNNRVEISKVYNTMLCRKEPLQYRVLGAREEREIRLNEEIKKYELVVRVIDFLVNEEVVSDTIPLRSKIFSAKTLLLTSQKDLRLEFACNVPGQYQSLEMEERQSFGELVLLPFDAATKEKIHVYWERESQNRGYYSESNLDISEILEQSDEYPLSWWVGLTESEYSLVNILNTASKIMGFKMVRSLWHIGKVFTRIYSELSEMTEALLSVISNYLKVYYYPEYFNRIQRVHKLVGLEEDCSFASKVELETQTMVHIVKLECPRLTDKFCRRSIVWRYLMYEYVYELFSRNIPEYLIIPIWNFLFKDIEHIQLQTILLSVALMKHYEEKLSKCKRVREVKEILESLEIKHCEPLLEQVTTLREKYFGESKGILEDIKNMIFVSKPLEEVTFEFYRRETAKLDERKESRELEKRVVLKKISRLLSIDLPEYPSRSYCLHIYLLEMPELVGSLYLKCNEVEYECLNYERSRYFIISSVKGFVSLQFVDNKSNEFTGQLLFSQGVDEFVVQLESADGRSIRVRYSAGLLTDDQIEVFKRGKKFDHFISPYVQKKQMMEEMYRNALEAQFLRQYDSSAGKDDIVKKIKVLFSAGTKSFAEVEFYLLRIDTAPITLNEKLELVKAYAKNLSMEYFMSENPILEKHLLKSYFDIMGFSLSDVESECFYKDSLDSEFDAPKIIKCRFTTKNTKQKELKLEEEANKYLHNKSVTSLYSDIIIDDLLQTFRPILISELQGLVEGKLQLLCSSYGEVFERNYIVKVRNNGKEIYAQECREVKVMLEEVTEPQVLMTEVLPSFTKITTILDYVNSNKNVNLREKLQKKEKLKVAENLNILGSCKEKISQTIFMRYMKHPTTVTVPFLEYYSELVHEIDRPALKDVYLNNVKTNLRAICLLRGALRFSDSSKVEGYRFDPYLGLDGNLRKLPKECKTWYFMSNSKEDHDATKHEMGKLFINYGYGVFRWEPCKVIGYSLRNKINKDEETTEKVYRVIHQQREKEIKAYEIQLKPNVEAELSEIIDNKMGSRTEKNEAFGVPLRIISKQNL